MPQRSHSIRHSWTPPSLEINATRYPWAPLHNDAVIEFKGQQTTFPYANHAFPTISHAVYASILPIEFLPEVSRISSVTDMKSRVLYLYNVHMKNMRTYAIERGYQELFTHSPEFRNALKQFTSLIEYTDNPNQDRVLQNIPVTYDDNKDSTITYVLRTYQRQVTKIANRVKTVKLDASSSVSPYREYAPPLVIDGLQFSSIIRYMYYLYLLYFIPADAYAVANETRMDDFPREFYNATQTFYTLKITYCLNHVLRSKFGFDPQLAKLLSALPVPFSITESESSFLSMHIAIQTEKALLRIKQQGITYRFLQVLDYKYWTKYESRKMQDWISARLFNLFTLSKTILIYLRKDREPISSDLLETILYRLFICDLSQKTVLVYHYPRSWEEDMVKSAKRASLDISKVNSKVKYLLWRFSCVLMYRARDVKNIPSYIQSVPTSFTKKQIYESIRTVLFKLYLIQTSQLREFVIDERMISTVQSMLRISQKMKLSNATDAYDREMNLYQHPVKRTLVVAGRPLHRVHVGPTQVRVDGAFLQFVSDNLLEYIPIRLIHKSAKHVYQLVEFIFMNQYAYSSTVRSMLYYFS